MSSTSIEILHRSLVRIIVGSSKAQDTKYASTDPQPIRMYKINTTQYC